MSISVYIQYADAGRASIVSFFGTQQDEAMWEQMAEYWKNLGITNTSDPLWKMYYDAQNPVFVQPTLPAPSLD